VKCSFLGYACLFSALVFSTALRRVAAQETTAPTGPSPNNTNCTATTPWGANGGYNLCPLYGGTSDPNQIFNPQGNGAGQGGLPAAISPQDPQASASGSAVSQAGFAPNFIGDNFGSGSFQPIQVTNSHVPGSPFGQVSVPGGALGSTVAANLGRVKLVENFSPMPRDRVFMNYSEFNNVPLTPTGASVNRFTPGFEKTFFDGRTSVEFRLPFAGTIGNTVAQNGTFPGSFFSSDSTQLGNATTYFKGILYRDQVTAVSGGLGVALPTAGNYTLMDQTSGQTLLHVTNQAVHLLPFLSAVYTPNNRYFAQGLLQFDFDPNGNPVKAQDFGTAPSGSLYGMGTARDANWVYTSLSTGYWIYRGQGTGRWLTGVAPMVELHCNTTTSNGQGASGAVPGGSTQVLGGGPSYYVLNGTAGVNFLLRDQASIVVAYATPIGSGTNQQFSSELRVLFNWYFGGPTRQSRVQF